MGVGERVVIIRFARCPGPPAPFFSGFTPHACRNRNLATLELLHVQDYVPLALWRA